jgi:hypothetical protein
LSLQRTSRRDWLRQASLAALCVRLGRQSTADAGWQSCLAEVDPSYEAALDPRVAKLFGSDPTKYRFTPSEEAFIEEVQRATFQFFWDNVNPYAGLVKDRSQANGPDARNVASIAATGFGLTALCIADKRGWQDSHKIRERVRSTLRFTANKMEHAHGYFCHFIDMQNGERAFNSEASSIDTAIFLCGALTCRGYFNDAEIQDLAEKLYQRVDWTWLQQGKKTLAMAWKPEDGFTKSRWDSYSEMIIVLLLGLGSRTYPLPTETWDAWERPRFDFAGVQFLGAHAPLFAHQYPQAWFDFRGLRDKYADYFTNSVIASKVHKLWCLGLASKFPDYSENLWGISASDSAHGYTVWGGPPAMGPIDGSVVPCAAGGSLPFIPEETIRVLRNIREAYARRCWKKYGFVDAFHPRNNWTGPDVLGIDAGITLVMAENARSGFVWQQFMKNEGPRLGMKRAGFAAG